MGKWLFHQAQKFVFIYRFYIDFSTNNDIINESNKKVFSEILEK